MLSFKSANSSVFSKVGLHTLGHVSVLYSLIPSPQMYVHSAEQQLPVETSNPPSWVLKLWFSTHNLTPPNNPCAAALTIRSACIWLSPDTTILSLSGQNCLLMRGAAFLRRRHHSDHHTQPGCQRHCVDENLERRNHYLDLAGIENYTSRFGAGEWTRARGLNRGGGGGRGGTEYRRPLKIHPEVPHYCGTCLKPLDWTTALLSSTNIWEQAGTIHQVFKGKERAVGTGNIRRNKQQPWSEGQWWHVIILMLLLVGKC